MNWEVGIAFICSGALHLLGAALFVQPNESVALIQGGQTGAIARLGNSFADMSLGAMAPVSPDKADPVRAETQKPTKVERLQDPVRLDVTAALITTNFATNADRSWSNAATAAKPMLEMIAPVPETNVSPMSSKRPTSRPARDFANPARRSSGGSGLRNSIRGQSSGQAKAKQTSSSQSVNAAEQGNAQAASNYPGQVFQRLNRVRKPKGIGRGATLVAFQVSRSGGLASASVVKSSGNKRLDRAALQHVSKAAPFPSPPKGAKTRFTFKFESSR